MTITQSGSAGTGAITITNEPAATLTDIAAAVSGCTDHGDGSFSMDREFVLVNSKLSIGSRESCTFEFSPDGLGAMFQCDDDSELDFQECSLFFNSDDTVGFTQYFGNTGVGPTVTIRGCYIDLGPNLTGANNCFPFFDNASKVISITDSIFINGTADRGAGRVTGAAGTEIKNNLFINVGKLQAYGSNVEDEDNRVIDAYFFAQFNSNVQANPTIEGPVSENLSVAAFQVLPRVSGTYYTTVINEQTGKTVSLLTSGTNTSRIAQIDWTTRYTPTVEDPDTGSPLQGVKLDIVPTTTGARNSTYSENSDASGEFPEALLTHSQDSCVNNVGVTNTQYGPFSIRFYRYDLLIDKRDETLADAITETKKPADDTTIVETTEATVAAYTACENLDKARDLHKLAMKTDLDVVDVTAGAASFELPYNLNLDAAASNPWEESGGTVTYKTATLAAGTRYSAIIIPSGKTYTLTGSQEHSAGLSVADGGDFSTPSLASLTGTIDLAGTWTVAATVDGLANNQPDIICRSTGTLVLSDVTAWNHLDLRGKTVEAGFAVSAPSSVVILQDAGATAPVQGGAGKLFILTGIDADAEIEKNGSNYDYFAPVNLTVVNTAQQPIQSAVVRFQESQTLNNRTYNDSKVAVDALTTDVNGIATGFTLFGRDTDFFPSQVLYLGKPGFNRLALTQTQDGATVGGSQLLSVDGFYTAAPASNLTIDLDAETIVAAGNDTTQGWYDYGINQWLSATEIHKTRPIDPVGAEFAIGDDYEATVNSGAITGAALQVGSGELLRLLDGSTIESCIVSGGLVVSHDENQCLSVAINSGTLQLSTLSGNPLQGSGSAVGVLSLQALSTGFTLDLRQFAITAGFQFENKTSSEVTVLQIPGQDLVSKVENPGTITIVQAYTLTLPNLADGDAVWLYDVTADTTLATELVSGGNGFSYSFNSEVGNTFRLIAQRKGKLQLTITQPFPTGDLELTDSLQEDTSYTVAGIDGATVTGVAFGTCPGTGEDGWALTPVDDTLTSAELYAFQSYYRATLTGIVQRTEWIFPTVIGQILNYTWPDDLFWYNGKASPTLFMTLTGANHQKPTDGTPIACGQFAETQFLLAGTSADIRADIDAISVQTTRVDGLIEDVGGDRFTAKALETAPDSPGTTPADVWSFGTRGLTEDVTTDTPSREASKADVSALSLETTSQAIKANTDNLPADPASETTVNTRASQASVDNLNDFDPATDVVSRVTLVDTTIVNIDMRGTDGANTIAPDNAGIADIKATVTEERQYREAIDYTTGIWTKYDVDNLTPLQRFQLLDSNGDPITDENTPVAERVPL